jgi:hypothetical protein
MIIVRGVYQAKYGKGDELVQLFKEGNDLFPGMNNSRIMTDLSGQFFTVVTEAEYASFSEWEADAQKIFSDNRFAAWFERMVPLVDGGRREFYTLVE